MAPPGSFQDSELGGRETQPADRWPEPGGRLPRLACHLPLRKAPAWARASASAAPRSSSPRSILPSRSRAGSGEQGRAGKTEPKGESKQSGALRSARSSRIPSASWRKESGEAGTSSESNASLLVSQVSCILSFSFGFLSLFPHLFLFQEPLPGPCLRGGGAGGCVGGKHTPKPISRKEK